MRPITPYTMKKYTQEFNAASEQSTICIEKFTEENYLQHGWTCTGLCLYGSLQLKPGASSEGQHDNAAALCFHIVDNLKLAVLDGVRYTKFK